MKIGKEKFKVLMIASLVLFAFSLLSLIISLISYDEVVLKLNDKLYILVSGLSLILVIVFLVLFIKNSKKDK